MKKRCLSCGSEFQAKRSDAKYCSTACRVAGHRRSKQEEARDNLEMPEGITIEWPDNGGTETLSVTQVKKYLREWWEHDEETYQLKEALQECETDKEASIEMLHSYTASIPKARMKAGFPSLEGLIDRLKTIIKLDDAVREEFDGDRDEYLVYVDNEGVSDEDRKKMMKVTVAELIVLLEKLE